MPSDNQNPWFLANTHEVSYCIDRDPAAFHSEVDVAAVFARVVARWQEALYHSVQLEGGPASPGPDGKLPTQGILLGRQHFTMTSDCHNADLTLKLGTLTREDQKALGDPKEVVAASYRTDYDTVQMRGKGFIYFAADTGPLRPHDPQLADRPWEIGHGSVFEAVLTHELGHVFGVPHETNEDSFMRANIPYIYTSQAMANMSAAEEAKLRQELGALSAFFTFDPGQSYTRCVRPVDAAQFQTLFGNVEGRCFRLSFSQQGGTNNFPIAVSFASDLEGPWHDGSSILPAAGGWKGTDSLVQIYLPKEQQVFQVTGGEFFPLVKAGARLFKGSRSATYQGRPLLIELGRNNEVSFTALVNGVLRPFTFDE